MIYVYRPQPSNSARELAQALGARRLRQEHNLQRFVRAGDYVICWGAAMPVPPTGVEVLNGTAIRNKYQDALQLAAGNVPTIQAAAIRPLVPNTPILDPAQAVWQTAQEIAEEFTHSHFARGEAMMAGVREVEEAFSRLHDALSRPLPTPSSDADPLWLGRKFNHVGGNDLLNPPATADYYVKKETLVREFRVHSFLGQSIRAGVKIPREGFASTPAQAIIAGARCHEWVRSHEGGWRISYDGQSVSQRHRDLAHAAIQALGLSFGAVDIGEKGDGSLIVLEVNRAPGLEGGTIGAYASAIQRWIGGAV